MPNDKPKVSKMRPLYTDMTRSRKAKRQTQTLRRQRQTKTQRAT